MEHSGGWTDVQSVRGVPADDHGTVRSCNDDGPWMGWRQPDETSQLVPGSKERLETLVWIFTAYHQRHLGYHLIAQNLNDRKVPSPDGATWGLKTIRSILLNPIYLGIEIRHRWSAALYNKLTATGSVPVKVDQDQLEMDKRKSVPHKERPRDEWQLVDVPHLKDLLPSPLREAATERIMKELDPDRPPHPRKGKALHHKHKHQDSPFLLTNLLHSKQTGHLMRGEVCDRKMVGYRKQYRYYFDSGAAVHAEKGLNIRRIPAEPVEQAVMGVIKQILDNTDEAAQRVRAAVAEQAVEQPTDDQQRVALQTELEFIRLRLRRAYKILGQSDSDALAEDMAADQKRLEEVQRQLKAMERSQKPQGVDVDEAVEQVVKHLSHLRQHLAERPLCFPSPFCEANRYAHHRSPISQVPQPCRRLHDEIDEDRTGALGCPQFRRQDMRVAD